MSTQEQNDGTIAGDCVYFPESVPYGPQSNAEGFDENLPALKIVPEVFPRPHFRAADYV